MMVEAYWRIGERIIKQEQKQDYRDNADNIIFYNLTPYFSWMMDNKNKFFSEKLLLNASNDPREHFSNSKLSNRVDLEITRLICQLYLQGNGIAQCDRLSMAFGVESRLPTYAECGDPDSSVRLAWRSSLG